MVDNPYVSTRSAPARTIRLALYEPDIPQNAGTLMRLCACLGVPMDLIEPAGFDASDRNLKRAASITSTPSRSKGTCPSGISRIGGAKKAIVLCSPRPKVRWRITVSGFSPAISSSSDAKAPRARFRA